MKIPDEGGIATGGHTIKINTNSIAGWGMSLSTNKDGNLVNNENEANVIGSLPSTADIQHATTLSNNTWGIALPYGTNAQHYSPEANYLTSDKNTLASTLYSSVAYFSQSPDYLIAQRSDNTIPATETRNIYYGVRVDNPSQLLAGDYQTQVVYTATVKLPPTPTNLSVSPTSYELGSGADSTVTIAGTNLASTYKVYIESNTDSTKQYDITNTITNLTDTGLTVTIPTDQTNPDLESGDYTIHVVTQGGEGTIGFAYKEPTAWEKAVYMQDMTPEACGAVSNGESKQLIDKRDDKMYWVAKLADGNCWMTQNLNLSLSTRTALIPETSDVTNPWTPRSSTTTSISGYGPNDSDETGKSYTTNRSYEGTYDSSNPGSAHYLVGTYYQYSAATAGCDLSIGGCANSICPVGWHLPSREEFQLLIDSGLSRENFNQAPYFFLRGGYLYETNVREGAEWGDYWSSTMQRTESPGFAYHLEVDSRGTFINFRVAWNGFSVRCVAD